LTEEKTREVIQLNLLPPEIFASVYWDVGHIFLEAEYADVYPPTFYASQAYWYLKGHFPCGWSGAFPAGKVIVY
jgi:hypothetical protein